MKRHHNVSMKVVLGLMLPVVWIAGTQAASARPPVAASATSTRTGPAGNTSTRVSSASYNAATQTFNRTSTTTLPSGKTITSNGQASYNPATQSLTQGRTTTGPNGYSATESRVITAGQPAN